MSRIFLSHSSSDDFAAIAIADWLREAGWDDLFLDLDPDRGIAAGERWERALNDAAYRCEAVIFLVSKPWLGSDWCRREFHLAQRLNKRMVGVLVEDIKIPDLPSELTEIWQMVNLARGTDHVMHRAVDPRSGKEGHVTFSTSGLKSLKSGLEKAGLDPRYFAWPPVGEPDRSPYRGMRPLEAEDAGIFFGRESWVVQGLDRIRGLRSASRPRLMVILGASGAGKSSFLRAGLLPRLNRDDSNFVALPPLRPERAVLSGETGLVHVLSIALRRHGVAHNRAELREAIDSGSEGILAVLSELVQTASPSTGEVELSASPPTIVLPIDQGEELFLTEGHDEAVTFLKILRGLTLSRDPSLIAVFTIRSDAYEALQKAKALEGLTQETFSLPPIPRGAYQSVIEGPAERYSTVGRKLEIDPKLTEALLHDVEKGGGKDALPLLAFTMERMFHEYGDDGDLTLGEYNQIGRIEGSIDAAVAQAFDAADGDRRIPQDETSRRHLLRRGLIPWLAGIDPETGEPRRRVAKWREIPEESRPLIERLVETRLLSTDVDEKTGERTIEPTHEALLRQWGMLKAWLDESKHTLGIVYGIERATQDWLANGQIEDWLAHKAGRLEEAEALRSQSGLSDYLGHDGLMYLEACRNDENARTQTEIQRVKALAQAQTVAATAAARTVKRTRVGFFIAASLAVFAGLIGYWGVQKANDADNFLRVSRVSALKVLAGQAKESLEKGDMATAMAITRFSLPINGDDDNWPPVEKLSDTVDVLFRSVSTNREIANHRLGHNGIASVAGVTNSSDVVIVDTGRGHTLIDAKEPEVLEHFDADKTLKRFGVTALFTIFSRDFNFPDSPDLDDALVNGLTLRDHPIARPLGSFKHPMVDEYQVGFSPDRRLVAAVMNDEHVRIWNTRTGHTVLVFDPGSPIVWSFAFDALNEYVAFASVGGRYQVLRLKDGKLIAEGRIEGQEITDIAFSEGAGAIITAGTKGSVVVKHLFEAEKSREFKAHSNLIWGISLAPKGDHFATASLDGTAKLWDISSAHEVASFDATAGAFFRAFGITRDGAALVSFDNRGKGALWDRSSGNRLFEFELEGGFPQQLRFSPGGEMFATLSSLGEVRIWDRWSGNLIATFQNTSDFRSQEITEFDFVNGGVSLAVALQGGGVRIYDATGTNHGAEFGGDPLDIWFNGDEIVYSVSSDRSVSRWKLASGYSEKLVDRITASGTIVSVGGDVPKVFARLRGGGMILDGTDGGLIAQLKELPGFIEAADFSHDSKKLLTVSANGQSVIWNANDGSVTSSFRFEAARVTAAKFLPRNYNKLIVAFDDGYVGLFDIEAIAFEKGLHLNGLVFEDFLASDDGEFIILSAESGVVVVWSTAEDTYKGLNDQTEKAETVAMSSDGRYLAVAESDRGVGIWSIREGSRLATLARESSVSDLTFATDGTRLAIATDEAVTLYSTEDWSQILELETTDDVPTLARFSESGARIAVGFSSGRVGVFDAGQIRSSMIENSAHIGKSRLGNVSRDWNYYGFGAANMEDFAKKLATRAEDFLSSSNFADPSEICLRYFTPSRCDRFEERLSRK